MENERYAQLNIVRRNLAELKPHPKNPRVHPHAQMAHLGRSIEKFSFTKGSIVYQKNTDYLLAGHAICETLMAKGFTEADVIEWETDDATATQFLIADNKTSDDSEWDIEQLEGIIKELDSLPDVDLRDTGFDLKELDELFPDTIQQQEETFEIDEAMEDESEPVTKTGNIWVCGKHRVMCGDSTKAEDVERLMKGEKANMVLTDPPYGVDYAGKNEFLNAYDTGNRIQTPILNDAITDYRKFFADFLSIVPFADYNVFYIFMLGKELHNLRLAIDDCVCVWGDYLVWAKNNHVLGRKDYNSKHEFIVYGWKGKHRFYGGFQVTLLEFDKPLRSELHPTQKPIELICKLIGDGSQDGDNIYDPFLGSGTTLIAAAKTGRICYGMEISERYCDVICRRYHDFTGDVPTLESTGEPFPVEQKTL